MEINKDFYDKLPGGVCQFLDSYIIKYSDEDWFEEAWNKYRKHVLENDIADIKMPGFIFNAYTNKTIEHSDIYDDDYLMHYGTPRHSGRYPWGSGDSPYQHSGDFYTRYNELKSQGLKETEIAEAMGMTTTRLRTAYSTAKDEIRRDKVSYAKSLQKDGLNNVEIGKKLGEKYNPNGEPIGESTVRSLLNADAETRMNLASKTAEELKAIVDKKGMIDIGSGVEAQIGVTSTKLNQAIDMLNMEGYEVKTIKIEQVTNAGNWTNLKVLAKPGTTYPDIYKAAEKGEIHSVVDYAENITRDDGKPSGFIYPKSLDSKRLIVRYDEDGGTNKDGVVEIRRGVKDLSLGEANYAQVRILVDDTHYIKGMAVYGDDKDFPPGVDLIFNSNKSRAKIGDDKLAALKPIDKNLKKDPTNPFGSAIKEVGGQSFYDDPNGEYTDPVTGKKQSLSLINKRSDEGDWNAWARELPSQFLSKQSMSLIKKQLKISQDDKQAEYDEIMSLTNPTVKKALLKDFAEDCDAASVHLKAASLPGQTYKVILPLTTIKDDEVYAPNMPDGSKVALIRYPHGGTFEIPILTVNNKNQEGRRVLTTTPADAIGINKKVADRLSGADFDGDTVMMVPTNDKIKISSKPPLKQLEGFDTKLAYGHDPGSEFEKDGVTYFTRNGHKFKKMTNTQMEMGKVSNLITDMTLKGANDEELARAVKHSMVVIDAEKHGLDYKASEIDNGIASLKKKYQAHENDDRYGGASTLISRAKSPLSVLEREEGAYFTKDGNRRVDIYDEEKKMYVDSKTGEVFSGKDVRKLSSDPNTGEKVYTYTGRQYNKVQYIDSDGKKQTVSAIEKDGHLYFKPKGEKEYQRVTDKEKVLTFDATERYDSTKMAETNDAHTLSSGTPQEEAYANYANYLKSLANKARLEAYSIEDIPYSASAKQTYQEQCDSLEYKYNQALLNKPKERQAQLIANSVVKAKLQDNPGMDEDHKNKLKQTELKKARIKVGATRNEIDISDLEWEAIQAGAISHTRLEKIIENANPDRLRQLAMPRQKATLSAAKVNRVKSMSKSGYTTDEIAKHLGVSVSTINKYLNGKES